VCPWPGPSFTESGGKFGDPISKDKLTELDAEHWELYHVAEDFAENHDVAAEHRDRLITLIGMWYVEAGKYNVLPVDGRGVTRFAEPRPERSPNRDRYVYYPHTQGIPTNAAAIVLNRSHAIIADVEIPDGGAEGMIAVHGGTDGGYGLYVKDGKLTWVHNYVAREYFTVTSTEEVPSGRQQLRFEFEVTGPPDFSQGRGTPGRAQLYFGDRLVGVADIPVTTPLSLGLTSPLTIGAAPGAPVSPDIGQPPFEFTGVIQSVTYDVTGDLIEDEELTMRRLMARQ
jgi:arylsulfatase